MFSKPSLLVRALRSIALALVVFLPCGASRLLAQAQPAPADPAQFGVNNPTLPEMQRKLDVDRDPIPTPDIEETVRAANVPGTSAPAGKGEIRKQKDGVYTLHQDVDEVLLNCAVVDEKGRPVMDLAQRNFRVWEDGVLQTTSSFIHQDSPVSMGILVDNSGSMRDKRAAVDGAAMKLLEESNRRDAGFVVNFNERAYLDQGFTTDLVALNRGLSHFDSHGPTALYDAVAASADELARHAKNAKQILLIVTDGADNASRLSLREAIRRVQNLGGPVVYTIGLLYDSDPKEYQRAHDDLTALSAETGGIAYFPQSLDQVDKIASEVAQDIRNQYVVGYHSSRAASLGGYRTVRVEATARRHSKLTVRTRRGYYAQPGQHNKIAGARQPQPVQADVQSQP